MRIHSGVTPPTARYILPEFRERTANGERVHNPYTNSSKSASSSSACRLMTHQRTM